MKKNKSFIFTEINREIQSIGNAQKGFIDQLSILEDREKRYNMQRKIRVLSGSISFRSHALILLRQMEEGRVYSFSELSVMLDRIDIDELVSYLIVKGVGIEKIKNPKYLGAGSAYLIYNIKPGLVNSESK